VARGSGAKGSIRHIASESGQEGQAHDGESTELSAQAGQLTDGDGGAAPEAEHALPACGCPLLQASSTRLCSHACVKRHQKAHARADARAGPSTGGHRRGALTAQAEP